MFRLREIGGKLPVTRCGCEPYEIEQSLDTRGFECNCYKMIIIPGTKRVKTADIQDVNIGENCLVDSVMTRKRKCRDYV